MSIESIAAGIIAGIISGALLTGFIALQEYRRLRPARELALHSILDRLNDASRFWRYSLISLGSISDSQSLRGATDALSATMKRLDDLYDRIPGAPPRPERPPVNLTSDDSSRSDENLFEMALFNLAAAKLSLEEALREIDSTWRLFSASHSKNLVLLRNETSGIRQSVECLQKLATRPSKEEASTYYTKAFEACIDHEQLLGHLDKVWPAGTSSSKRPEFTEPLHEPRVQTEIVTNFIRALHPELDPKNILRGSPVAAG